MPSDIPPLNQGQSYPKMISNKIDEQAEHFITHELVDLSKFKTVFCTSTNHHALDAPYYYDCHKYHSWKDQRRNPYHKNDKLVYSGVFLGDSYSKQLCMNWIEYEYHPQNYKTQMCSIAHQNHACGFKFCPKIHPEGEKEKEEIDKIVRLENPLSSLCIDDGFLTRIKGELQQLESIRLAPYAQHPPHIQDALCRINERVQRISEQYSKVDEAEQKLKLDVKKRIEGLAMSEKQLKKVEEEGKEKEENLSKACLFDHGFREFTRGEQLNIIEDRHNEFKMFREKDHRRIASIVLEYISAFLNSEGGNIYLGVDDYSIVQGLSVSQKWLDQLMQAIDIDGKIQLNPPLIPQKYRLRVIPVRNPRREWLNVVQIQVYPQPKNEKKVLTLFNRECYLRMNSSNHRLSASDIIEYMRLNNLNKEKEAVGISEESVEEMSEAQLRRLQENMQRIQEKVKQKLKK